ncbi:MAG: hypothetical protein QOH66_622 [Actinomycetota bacterium]|nr:hypothetical protein [Actinomycetota bacterium]
MAVTLVQKKGAQSAGNTSGLVVTLDAPPTPGNLLVAACNSDATVSTPAGFTLAVSAVSGQGLYIFYRVVQAGDGSSVTFAPSVADSCAGGVIEYSGLTATPLDQTASNTTNSSATSLATGTTPTTNQASELVIVVVGPHANNNHPWVLSSWSAGYTSQIEEPNGLATVGSASSACHIGDQIVGATGAYAATGTWAPASSDAGAAIATFKAVAGTVHALAATGLAATTGSAALNVTIVLAATGLAATSGSAALAVNVTLSASGLAATTGSAALSQWHSLSATGLAATTGTAAVSMKWSLAATGLASTSGSMNVGLPVPMAAAGLAATTGSFAFASATPFTPGPTKIALGASGWPTKTAI